MVISQYPYDLEKLNKTDAVFDENTGTWTPGTEKWELISKCRDENNAGGKTITTDGEVYVYGALVQMPKGVNGIESGDQIRIKEDSGDIRLKGEVRLFKNRQLHSQLWL